MGESRVAFYSIATGGCDRTIFNGSKEKKEGLQSAIFTIFVGGISVSVNMRRVKASMTIEASLIVPLLLFLFSFAMQTGITMYEECIATAKEIQEEPDLDIVKTFYHWKKVGEWLEDASSLY